MAIPERLRLHPANQKLVHEMSELCDKIENALDSGETAEELLQQWHRHATRRYDSHEFQSYWKAVSQETFVQEALNPAPVLDTDVVYAELLAVLETVSRAEVTEAELGYYLGWIDAQLPGASISALIYWPDEWFGDASLFRDANGCFKPEAELSSVQILAYAMAKSGRSLPGAPTDVSLPFRMPEEC